MKRTFLRASLLFVIIAASFNCGDTASNNIIDGSTTDPADATIPTIASVVRADGITLEPGVTPDDLLSATIADATMTVIFSEDIDPDTITADNITLTGGETAVPLVFSVSADNTTVTLTQENDLPQLVTQTLTFTDSISDGINSLEEVSYTFNTGCATSDLFNSPATFDQSNPGAGCWTLYESGDTTYTMGISEGSLNYSSPGNRASVRLSKDFTATDLTATLSFASLSDFDVNNDLVELIIYDQNYAQYVSTMFAYYNGEKCQGYYSPTGSGGIEPIGFANCTTGNLNALRIEKSGTTFEFFYDLNSDAGDFISMGTKEADLGSPYWVSVVFYNDNGDDGFTARIDSFTVTGASATDQD